MKSFVSILLALIYSNAFSQNCNEYIHFKKGATFEMATFDPKGIKQSRVESTVQEIKTSGGGDEAIIHSVTYDESNIKEAEGDFKAICLADKIKFDISSLLTSDKMGGGNNSMNINIEAGYLEIPKTLNIGQSLPDDHIKITLSKKNSGNLFGTTQVTIQDKKVESREPITTPAGIFSCYKITYKSKIETNLTMNNMTMPTQIYPGVYYISQEVGLVKAVNFDNRKAVRSYSLLIKVKK